MINNEKECKLSVVTWQSNFAGEAPSSEGPCNLSRPSRNFGYILFFKADPTLWTFQCPEQPISKLFTKTLCHIHSKYCLMRPVMGWNCHTQGHFFGQSNIKIKVIKKPLFPTNVKYFSLSKYNYIALIFTNHLSIDWQKMVIMTQIHCCLW